MFVMFFPFFLTMLVRQTHLSDSFVQKHTQLILQPEYFDGCEIAEVNVGDLSSHSNLNLRNFHLLQIMFITGKLQERIS